jgi:RimJ/RimL family protein N-acetyltransferase
MGFWMAVDCWGQGYCTEAARAALAFAFETMNLARVGAHHFSNNPASGRVLEKIGMLNEGRLRDAVLKDGHRYDAILYGMTRRDWEQMTK